MATKDKKKPAVEKEEPTPSKGKSEKAEKNEKSAPADKKDKNDKGAKNDKNEKNEKPSSKAEEDPKKKGFLKWKKKHLLFFQMN